MPIDCWYRTIQEVETFKPKEIGTCSWLAGLSVISPISLGLEANPFATPLEILPEWYFFPTFNLLRILPSKFIGVLSQMY